MSNYKLRKNLPYSDLTDKIIKEAIGIHKRLGPGFVEKIYQRALYLELKNAGLRTEREKKVGVIYKKASLGYGKVDFIVQDVVVVEIKAASEIKDIHKAQLLSYLKTTDKRVGLILNFGRPVLEIKRVVN